MRWFVVAEEGATLVYPPEASRGSCLPPISILTSTHPPDCSLAPLQKQSPSNSSCSNPFPSSRWTANLNVSGYHFHRRPRLHLLWSQCVQDLAISPLMVRYQIATFCITDHLLEHLNNIRKCIVIHAATKGRQQRKHIDIGRFWKDAFERSQQESLKLQDEMAILRQQSEKSQGTVKTPQKRRTKLSVVTKANTQSKRRKTEPHDHGDTDAGSGSEQDGEPCMIIPVSIYAWLTVAQSYKGFCM